MAINGVGPTTPVASDTQSTSGTGSQNNDQVKHQMLEGLVMNFLQTTFAEFQKEQAEAQKEGEGQS